MRISRRNLRRLIRESLDTIPAETLPDSAMLASMRAQPEQSEDLGIAALTDIIAQPESDVDMSHAAIQREKKIFKALFLETFGGTDPGQFKKMSAVSKPWKPGTLEVRFGPASSRDPDVTPQMARDLITALDYEIHAEIDPGGSGSKSSQGVTYVVRKDSRSTPFSVVFGSANEGEKFEEEVRQELKDGTGPLADSLVKALGLDINDITHVSEGSKKTARPLTPKMQNDGPIISDITITTAAHGPIYLSIKNPKGKTYSNPGYGGGIKMCARADENTPERCELGEHDLDDFLKALGIDKKKIVQGINDFLSNTTSPPKHCPPESIDNFDAAKVTEYLQASFGYGYVYARHERSGAWKILDLTSPENVVKLIGTVTSVVVSYARYGCSDQPYPSSKGTRATVTTSTGGVFDVSVRNKSGSVLPTGMAISIRKYPDKNQTQLNPPDLGHLAPTWAWGDSRQGRALPGKHSHPSMLERFSIHDFIFSD